MQNITIFILIFGTLTILALLYFIYTIYHDIEFKFNFFSLFNKSLCNDELRGKNNGEILKLARLYHHGSKNDKPNAKEAIKYYKEAIRRGYFGEIANLAKIFQYGIYGFPPNAKIAKKLHNILRNSEDNRLKIDAEEEINFGEENDAIFEQNNNAIFWQNDDDIFRQNNEYYGNDITVQEQYDLINDIFEYDFDEIYNFPVPNDTDVFFNFDYIIPEEIMIEENNEIMNGGNLRNNIPAILNNRNDSQNVHDSGVVNSLKETIKKLKENTPNEISKEEAMVQIRNYTKNLKAQKTMDGIERNTVPVYDTDLTLSDALTMVWNRIHTYSPENQEIAKDNLINELVESIENDRAVCTAGKFTRIFDALNVIDNDVKIINNDTIKNEIFSKAAKIRENVYNSLSENDREIVDKLDVNDLEKDVIDKYEKNVVDNIRNELHNNYANSKIVTKEYLDKELDKWAEYIF